MATAAGGFIGSYMGERLVELGARMLALPPSDLCLKNLAAWFEHDIIDTFKPFTADRFGLPI